MVLATTTALKQTIQANDKFNTNTKITTSTFKSKTLKYIYFKTMTDENGSILDVLWEGLITRSESHDPTTG